MKYKIIILVLITLFYSNCEKSECACTLIDMQIYPIVSYETDEPASIIPNWYHSTFQTGQLHFSIEFSYSCGGWFCEHYWANYPLENTIEIYCDKDILAGVDTIRANEKLNEYFNIKKFEDNFRIAFFISEITEKNIQLDSTYYTFRAKLLTDKDEEMQNECLVKIN